MRARGGRGSAVRCGSVRYGVSRRIAMDDSNPLVPLRALRAKDAIDERRLTDADVVVGLPGVAAGVPAARLRAGEPGRERARRPAPRPRRQRGGGHLRLRPLGEVPPDRDRDAAYERRHRQPFPPRQPHHLRPPREARVHPRRLPGDRLRDALPHHGRFQRGLSVDPPDRRRARDRIPRSLRRLRARSAGAGPHRRHRDDRRKGGPEPPPPRAAEPGRLSAGGRATPGGHRGLRDQGDCHLRPLRPPPALSPRPQHAGGGRGLRRRVRGSHRRGRPHRRQPPRRTPRRIGGGLLRQVRPDDRGVHLRPGVRAVGAGLPVRGVGPSPTPSPRPTRPTTARPASALAPASATSSSARGHS